MAHSYDFFLTAIAGITGTPLVKSKEVIGSRATDEGEKKTSEEENERYRKRHVAMWKGEKRWGSCQILFKL